MNKTIRTKAYAPIVKEIFRITNRNCVVMHEKTPQNPLGQTSTALIICDILDIVLNSENESEACRNLFEYFENGDLVK